MKINILRGLLIVGGLLFVLIGGRFLITPNVAGAEFGLIAEGAQGLSSIRADLTAFFWVGGGCMIWGAWSHRRDPLLIAAALFGTALLGRTVSLIQNGSYDGWWSPILVETATTLLCFLAARILPRTS